MEQLISECSKYQDEINALKQIICELEAINDVLKSQIDVEPKNPYYSDWIEIKDQKTIFNILTSYYDPIKKLVLEEMTKCPMTIQEIIQQHSLPQASTYRKITELIDCRLIVKQGFFLQNDSKRVYKYTNTIKNMKIHFEENKILIFVLPMRKNSGFQNLCTSIY